MKKSIGPIMAMAAMMQPENFNRTFSDREPTMGRVIYDWKPSGKTDSGSPKTKKQIRARMMSKIQRRSRKINRRK